MLIDSLANCLFHRFANVYGSLKRIVKYVNTFHLWCLISIFWRELLKITHSNYTRFSINFIDNGLLGL